MLLLVRVRRVRRLRVRRLLARRLLNGLQFFTGGVRWICFIPAALLLGERRITGVVISPVVPPAKKKSYCYECYRDAWALLRKSRRELAEYTHK